MKIQAYQEINFYAHVICFGLSKKKTRILKYFKNTNDKINYTKKNSANLLYIYIHTQIR